MNILDHSIVLANWNGENLAEFLVMVEKDNPENMWVKCIPFFGMHEVYRTNASDPMPVQAGMTMPAMAFLGYIANLIRSTKNKPDYYEMTTYGTKSMTRVRLIQPVSVSEIARLTGFDPEMIRAYYKDHFVI